MKIQANFRQSQRWATLIPTVFSARIRWVSRPDLIKRPIGSWAELLNPEFKGKASILNMPSIGIMDAAMVVQVHGEYQYPDKGGKLTRDEIDMTAKILTETGQRLKLWSGFNESVNLMASGQVIIQSMSPRLRLSAHRASHVCISH